MTEDRLIAALVSATFQTAALALLIAVVLRLAPRTSATARCAIWTGALFVAVALPAVDFARVEHVSALEQPKISGSWSAATTSPVKVAAVGETARTLPVVRARIAAAPAPAASVKLSLAAVVGRIARIAVYLWCAGVAFFALRLLYQIACLLRAKAEIEPTAPPEFLRASRLRRRVTLGTSERVAVPCLLGLFRPVIALPHVLAADLSSEDIARIVMHEAAHLERFDDWFNLFEQIALVFLFFNPALHYIARQIGMEREIACDDHVIAKSQNRITYAECLTELARRCAGRRALTVPGFFTNRRQILVRVEQLLDRAHNGSPRIGRKAVAAVGMVTAAGLLFSQVGIPVMAAAICPLQKTTPRAIAPRQTIAYTFAPLPASLERARPVRAIAPRGAVIAPRKSAAPRRAIVARAALPAHNMVAPRARVASVAAAAPVAVSVATAVTSESVSASASSTAPVAAAIAHAVNAVASADGTGRSQDASYSEGASLSGYAGMSADQIVDLHDHGVDGTYIEKLKAAGYGGLSPQDLIALRDHDVSGAFASAMTALAGHKLKISELVDLRDHGVDPSYAGALARYGLRGMAVAQLIELRDHGVSPEYLAGLAQAGFAGLAADQTIRLRDHGVTPSYIAHIRHDLNPTALTVEELIKLRDAGI